jgi:hypothetical protein
MKADSGVWPVRREHAAEAREVVADRAGHDPAAAGRPVEIGRAGDEPRDVAAALRQDACENLRLHAGGLDRPHRALYGAAAGPRADIAVGEKVDRAPRPAAVRPCRRLEGPQDLRDGIPAAGRDAEHRRQQGAGAANFEQFALLAPAVPAAEADGRRRRTVGAGRAEVAVARRIEPVRPAALHGGVEHRHARERAGGKLEHLLLRQFGGQFGGVIDPPGKAAGVDDLVDLRSEPTGVDGPQDRLQDLGAEAADGHALVAVLPGKHEHVARRHLPQRRVGVGDGKAVGTRRIHDQQHVLRPTAGPGRRGGEDRGQQADGGAAELEHGRKVLP